jgi:hypothetical protein
MGRRKQPPTDIWNYFEQKEREYAELSLEPERSRPSMFSEEHGSEGMRGRVFGYLFLTDRAYLQVSELVQVEGDHVHREEYAYFLVIDREEVWGYERDPTHNPPEHRHVGPSHRREPCGPVAFRQVAELAWDEVTRRSAY